MDGARKCVTFYPTSVIVDENSRQCGEKCLQGMQYLSPHPNPSDYQEIKHPSVDAHELPLLSKKLKHQSLDKDSGHAVPTARNVIAKHQKTNSIVEVAAIGDLDKEDEDGEKDDNVSCSSSDLFELENLAEIDMNMSVYQKELPVYETTHLETNKAIARGMIV